MLEGLAETLSETLQHVAPPFLVLAAGLVLSFLGYRAMRWILMLVGAYAGWSVGGYVSAFIDVGTDFKTAIYWGAAILLCLLFGALAFAFYTTGVLIAVGALGYCLGINLAPMLGLTGLNVMIAGGCVGVVLVIAAYISRLPKVLLVVATSLAGAAAIVLAVLDLIGWIDVTALSLDSIPALLRLGLPVYLGFFVLLAAGVFVQLKGKTKSHLKSVYS